MNVWKECIAASFTPYKLIADLKCLCWHSKRNLQWKVMWKFSCSNYAWLIFIKCLFVDIHRIPWSKCLHVTRKLQKLNEGKNNNKYWYIAIISYRLSIWKYFDYIKYIFVLFSIKHFTWMILHSIFIKQKNSWNAYSLSSLSKFHSRSKMRSYQID